MGNSEITTTLLRSSGKRKLAYVYREMCMRFEKIMKNFGGPLVIYDLETTGLNKITDRIVQLAAIKLCRDKNHQYQVVEEKNWYLNPGFPMPAEASAVNHITDEMLADAPTEDEAFSEIKAFFGNINEGGAVVCGYNIANFDNKVMEAMYMRQGEFWNPAQCVDILVMARELLDRATLANDSFKQESVAEMFGFLEDTMHNAITDTRVSGKIMFALYNLYLKWFKVEDDHYAGYPTATISGMVNYRQSKLVNYVNVFFGVMLDGKITNGQFHYDRYNWKWVEDSPGDLMTKIDMRQFVRDADRYAGGSVRNYKGKGNRRY